MATRLYFHKTAASEPKPNAKQSAVTIEINHWLDCAFGGGQDSSVIIYPCDMSTLIGAEKAASNKNIKEPGAAHYGWCKAFISPALEAQTINGTFSLVCDYAEDSALANMNPVIFIYVWKSDDSGSRGTLYGPAISTLEADLTIATLQTFTFSSYDLTSLPISAGDRIVIEMMLYDNNTRTNAWDHYFGFNGPAASGGESYIEFSMNIAWLTVPTEVYAAEAILDYEFNPCEVYAAEAILDYAPPPDQFMDQII